MLKILDNNLDNSWNSVVKSYANWDVYYLYEYANSFALHGDGQPLLICYDDDKCRFCYVVMKQDIAACDKFNGRLPAGQYFDLETPYGYGGALFDNDIPEISQINFMKELKQYCEQEHIVSQFIRFHPVLGNYNALPKVTETRYLRDTVYIDTTSPDLIMSNMDSKNRNMVRKAIKSGVKIVTKPVSEYEDFLLMYKETMLKNCADDYYTFNREYFEVHQTLSSNANIFYAMYEGKAICGAIMYFNKQFMHYHLAGTHTEYRKLAPSNLLLYEAACWASDMGITKFHLGGGMSADDSLFGFKKQFNRFGRLQFYVGRTIFDKDSYEYLKQLRKSIDSGFDMDNGFMIQYRR